MGFGAFEVLNILLFSLLHALVLAAIIVIGVRWAVANGLRDAVKDEKTYVRIRGSAKEILDRRYADGEIGREDFLRIRDDIEGNTGRTDA